MKTFTVQLGEISVAAADTDEVLRQKAQSHLPKALEKMGARAAQEAWTALEREIRNSPFEIKADKSSFIRDTARQFVNGITASEKKGVEDDIFHQLLEQRKGKRGQTG